MLLQEKVPLFFIRELQAQQKRENSSVHKEKEMWTVTHQTHTAAFERQQPVWYRGASGPIQPQNCSCKAKESQTFLSLLPVSILCSVGPLLASTGPAS